jgi:hypothetical protein
MALKILYHGTDIESADNICKTKEIDVKRGSAHTDFGQGFYTTDNFDRAVRWAYRKAHVRRSKPAVITLYFDEESAKSIIEYFSDDLRWGRFIINNRNGLQYISKVPFQDNNLDSRYEITSGRIADVEVTDVADELKEAGTMLNSLDRILNANYPQQIAFHTTSSTQYIKKMSYRSV